MIALWVALAGGVGAVLRFTVDSLIAQRARRRMPLGTVVINVTGSFLLGLLTALAIDHAGLADAKAVLGTGLLGGYTTFSTASVEAVNLSLGEGPGSAALAGAHAGAMLLISMAAGMLGLWLG
jgi:fluoride exporter